MAADDGSDRSAGATSETMHSMIRGGVLGAPVALSAAAGLPLLRVTRGVTR